MNKNILLFLLWIISTTLSFAQVVPVKDSEQNFFTNTVTDEGAWCWFADPRALHYKNESGSINSTYIGYIDVHGYIKATQIDHLAGKTSEVIIRSYFQPDDHNNPTFLVLPDERVMIFYSRHTDEACFYYRVSSKPGDITTLGKEIRLVTNHNTTYPSPFILSDDPEHIYLCWRGIGWHPTIARLSVPDAEDNVEFDWGPFQMVRSMKGGRGVRPYAKYVSNGKDKIYFAYTSTHPDNQRENHIYLNYVDINTKELKDISGEKLAVLGKDKLHEVNISPAYKESYPNAVVDDTALRNWLWEVTLDKDEKPVIATVGISEDKSSHDYYHIQWTGRKWQKTFLSNAGGHFHQADPVTERCYSGGMAIDKYNPQVIYGSVPVDGEHGQVYELKKFTVSPYGELSSVEQLTFDSPKNNVRPFTIANSSDELSLSWMYGDYHDWIVSAARPKGYSTAIRTNLILPVSKIELKKGLRKKYSFSKTSVQQIPKIKVKKAKSFTINLNVSIDSLAYYGDILRFAGLTFTVPNGELPRPYLNDGNSIWPSSNVLGNSDNWTKHPRGTNGKWYALNKLTTFQLTFTYAEGVLRSYINGLVDQSVDIPSLVLSDISFGEFQGSVDSVAVYSRLLSQDEIKALRVTN